MFTIGGKKLRGRNRRDVEATAAAAVAAYEQMRASSGHIDEEALVTQAAVAKPAPPSGENEFSFEEAKRRFLAAVENEIGPNRRAEIESHFWQSIDPFFMKTHNSTDPEQWPTVFDLFRAWLLKGRRRLDGRPGHIKARTANCHLATLNKFLRFCREVYGLNISSNCKRFGKKILERESRANNGNGVTTLHNVWTEEEFAEFRKVAYELDPQLALVYDLCFGLGLRRGEAIALRVGCVHLDDPQVGPLGYAEINQQYTEELATREVGLKLPKWERTRVIPLPYEWLAAALRERISGRGHVHPQNNELGLRYAAERYPNTVIAGAMGVTECAVRKWLKGWQIKRDRRLTGITLTKKVKRDIADHLSFGQCQKNADDYFVADGRGRLPLPNHVGHVFRRIIEKAGVKRIRTHDLRHSFGSIWAQRVPLSVLKAMMGHASVKTTEQYIHTTGEVFRLTMTEALRNMAGEEGKNG